MWLDLVTDRYSNAFFGKLSLQALSSYTLNQTDIGMVADSLRCSVSCLNGFLQRLSLMVFGCLDQITLETINRDYVKIRYDAYKDKPLSSLGLEINPDAVLLVDTMQYKYKKQYKFRYASRGELVDYLQLTQDEARIYFPPQKQDSHLKSVMNNSLVRTTSTTTTSTTSTNTGTQTAQIYISDGEEPTTVTNTSEENNELNVDYYEYIKTLTIDPNFKSSDEITSSDVVPEETKTDDDNQNVTNPSSSTPNYSVLDELQDFCLSRISHYSNQSETIDYTSLPTTSKRKLETSEETGVESEKSNVKKSKFGQ